MSKKFNPLTVKFGAPVRTKEQWEQMIEPEEKSIRSDHILNTYFKKSKHNNYEFDHQGIVIDSLFTPVPYQNPDDCGLMIDTFTTPNVEIKYKKIKKAQNYKEVLKRRSIRLASKNKQYKSDDIPGIYFTSEEKFKYNSSLISSEQSE